MTTWRCRGPPAPSKGVLEASLPQNCILFYFCCLLNREGLSAKCYYFVTLTFQGGDVNVGTRHWRLEVTP